MTILEIIRWALALVGSWCIGYYVAAPIIYKIWKILRREE